MIIDFPTALYNSILPREPEVVGNITFTISSNDPPRSTEVLAPLLKSEELRALPDKAYSMTRRRANLGDLIFTISSGKQDEVEGGSKAFEIGELLDFDDAEDLPEVSDLNVPNIVELQQNTNLIDLASVGLSEEQSDGLSSDILSKFNNSIIELNGYQTDIQNVRKDIRDNQKSINEVRKAMEAAQVVFSDMSFSTESNDILEILETREANLLTQRDSLVETLNSLTSLANETYNEILKLKEFVR